MKRKFLALLSVLCLCISLLPTAALATETTDLSEDSTDSTSTSESSLLEQMALANGDKQRITLGNDIDLTKAFVMPENANVILDLNGYAITGYSIQILVNSCLTIEDSRPNETTHTLADGTTVTGGLIASELLNNGIVTLTSGTLTNLSIGAESVFYAEGGTVLQTVQNGGTITRIGDGSEEPSDPGFTTFSGTVTDSYNDSPGTIDQSACMLVTFQNNSDSNPDSAPAAPQSILKGQKASDPNITQDGKTAIWYQGETRWDFSAPVMHDLTLTARWGYPIVIESAGHGTVTPSNALAAPGETVSLQVEPETGYQLASLVLTYTPSAIADDSEEGEQPVTIDVTDNQFLMPDGRVSGVASFALCRYFVFYDFGFDELNRITTVSHGDRLSPWSPERPGYTLSGWYNGDTKWDFENDVVTDDMTLVAKWSSTSPSNDNGNNSTSGSTNNSGSNLDRNIYLDDVEVDGKVIMKKKNVHLEVSENTMIKQIELRDSGKIEESQDDVLGNLVIKKEANLRIDLVKEKEVEKLIISEATVDALKTINRIGLTASFSSGTVHLDSAAVQQIGGGDVSVSVTEVPQENLSSQQKKAIEQAQCSAALVVDISVLANGQEQTSFGDGTLTISVPMPALIEGVQELLSVWYVRDDGSIERMEGAYDAKTESYVFYTNHLSQYLLVYPEKTLAFTDVPMESYYYPAVLWAVENNITTGATEATFAPEEACTRAQIVTFLWRTAGAPQPTILENPFSDGTPGAYYENAVLWAVENGIVTGTTDTTFSPEAPCTREQTAAMLYRFAQAQGEDVSVGEDTNLLSFADAEAASPYAIPALQWAVGANILQGDGENLLPKATCTRAQIMTMLWRESEL